MQSQPVHATIRRDGTMAEEEARFLEEILHAERNRLYIDCVDELAFAQAELRRSDYLVQALKESTGKKRYRGPAALKGPFDKLNKTFPERSRTELETLRGRVLSACIHALNFSLEGMLHKSPAAGGSHDAQIRTVRNAAEALLRFFEAGSNDRLSTVASQVAAKTCSRLGLCRRISEEAGDTSERQKVTDFVAALCASFPRTTFPGRRYRRSGCLRYSGQSKRRRHHPDPATMLMMDLLFAFDDPTAERHFELAYSLTEQTLFRGDKIGQAQRKKRMRDSLSQFIERNPGLRVGSWLADN